ncbi:zinc finger protein 511 isoform X2 [Corythoichthys intestinalis]|uniref:zinc finger protein 511 isoform X2 n=1 Tax=Corythoichthys intestinalis TaxID=161448 RepID=UPI0025A5CC70|nr:zinc finger protein 511 isoform X2 [Corythoichthys intestinalis]
MLQPELVPTQEEDENPFNFSPQLIMYLHKDHELFEDGDVERHMYLQDLYISEADGDKQTLRVSEFACHISGCNAVHATLEEYEHHYNSLHRHVCSICRRSLPTARLLDIHIQEWHDSVFMVLAQRQDMYQCLVEGCGHKFRTSTLRKDHLIRIHKYPPDFRFDKPKREKGHQETKQQQAETAMEVADNVSAVLCEEQSKQAEQEESMEMPLSTTEIHFCEKGASHEEQAAGHNTNDEHLNPRYSYRVPSTVCFGHGSTRGFRGQRGRRK